MKDLKTLIVRNRKLLTIAALAVVAVCLFLGDTFISLIHNKIELKNLSRQTIQLDQQYEQLQKKLSLLKKQDPVYLERVARVEYHMSKPGETEFRFKAD